MPRHTLKLLVLLMAFSVAPASAGRHSTTIPPRLAVVTWNDDTVTCPYERARLAAEAAAAQQAWPKTITLTDRVPTDGPLLGRGSSFLNP